MSAIILLFSTIDTSVAVGRARVLSEVGAAVAPAGLTGVFQGITANLGWPGGRAPETEPLAALAPILVPLGDDQLVLDVADMLLSRQTGADGQGNPTLVVYGYIANVSLRLRQRPANIAPLAGLISDHWTDTALQTAPPEAWMTELDPGRSALEWYEAGSVRYWPAVRYRRLI